MKTTRKIVTVIASLALLLSTASCALLEKKADFTQKITAGNIEATIRDDMKEDSSMKEKGYLTCYFWDGFGMNIASFGSTESRWAGEDSDAFLTEMLQDQDNVTEIKKAGEYSYIEYNLKDNDNTYVFSDFILEKGYEYYVFEFYTLSKTSEKYMSQYTKILSSVKLLAEPAKTVEATIDGVKVTLDGDAYDYGDNFFLCGRYLVNAFQYKVAKADIESKDYCSSLIAQNDYKGVDGKTVTEINTAEDGVSSFECLKDGRYIYYYVKIVNKNAIGVIFVTVSPADNQLKSDFAKVASDAAVA